MAALPGSGLVLKYRALAQLRTCQSGDHSQLRGDLVAADLLRGAGRGGAWRHGGGDEVTIGAPSISHEITSPDEARAALYCFNVPNCPSATKADKAVLEGLSAQTKMCGQRPGGLAWGPRSCELGAAGVGWVLEHVNSQNLLFIWTIGRKFVKYSAAIVSDNK